MQVQKLLLCQHITYLVNSIISFPFKLVYDTIKMSENIYNKLNFHALCWSLELSVTIRFSFSDFDTASCLCTLAAVSLPSYFCVHLLVFGISFLIPESISGLLVVMLFLPLISSYEYIYCPLKSELHFHSLICKHWLTCKNILFHFSLPVEEKAHDSSHEQTILSPSISRKSSREKTRYGFKIYYFSIFCYCSNIRNRILIENTDSLWMEYKCSNTMLNMFLESVFYLLIAVVFFFDLSNDLSSLPMLS